MPSDPVIAALVAAAQNRTIVTLRRPDRPAETCRLLYWPASSGRRNGRHSPRNRAKVELASGAVLSVPIDQVHLVGVPS